MKRLLRWLVVLVVVGIGIVAARTAMFKSRQLRPEASAPMELSRDVLATHIAGALRFPTISHQDPAEDDLSAFEGFRAYLESTFPRAHAELKRELVAKQSLLFMWQGSDVSLSPILLLSHQDVVPVEPGTESQWSHPPFDGIVADGFIWGRGAWDDKSGVLAILDAIEALLAEHYHPRRTIFLAFGHDEEVGGRGAAALSSLLRERGVRPEWILDEGGAITRGIVPGIDAPVAVIGIAEKGYLTLELTVSSAGGHSSAPPESTAIGILAEAVRRLETHPMSAAMAGVARQTFEFIGPEMRLPEKALFANLWLFSPLILGELSKAPATNALIRTTTAVTMFDGGVKENVLPSRARAVVNFRILPGDTSAEVLAHTVATIGDPRVKVARLGDSGGEPSPASSPDAPSFAMLQKTVRQVAPDAIVAPTLVLGATDARHYTTLSPNVYRFLPVVVRSEDMGRFHGLDERVSVEDYERCVRFFAQLIRNADVQAPASEGP